MINRIPNKIMAGVLIVPLILGGLFYLKSSTVKNERTIKYLVNEPSFIKYQESLKGKVLEPDKALKIESPILKAIRIDRFKEAVNFCTSGLEAPDEECYIRIGEALFYSKPYLMESNFKLCEEIINKEGGDIYQSRVNKCASGLLASFLNQYKVFMGEIKLKAGESRSLVEFCKGILSEAKYACVQEISLFIARNSILDTNKKFNSCAIFKEELSMLCQVGIGRGVMINNRGLLKSMDQEAFYSCYQVVEVEYRARCFMVMGSLDEITDLNIIKGYCQDGEFKGDFYCNFLMGGILLGREHGEVDKAYQRCADFAFEVERCRLGVLIAFLNINNVKERVKDTEYFFHRQRINVTQIDPNFSKVKSLAYILGSSRESLPVLLSNIASLKSECKGYLNSCQEAVGLIMKRFNYSESEVAKWCSTEACFRGYKKGLTL